MLTQVWVQIEGVLAVAIYSALFTFLIAKTIEATMGLRVNDEDEYVGLDIAVHGERLD
jgi:Amt family ammonium transporter